MKTHIPTNDPVLSWEAPEYLYHKRSRRWYIVASALVLACFVFSILTAAWTFSILIVLITGIYVKTHHQESDARRMRIWKEGFALDDQFVDWHDCKGFWILKGKGYFELHIERESAFASDIKIQTGSVDPYKINEAISPFLATQTERREKTLDFIIRICKL